jgi:hypothetical protein
VIGELKLAPERGDTQFIALKPKKVHKVDSFSIVARPQKANTYDYRISVGSKSVVLLTDYRGDDMSSDIHAEVIDFVRYADALIFGPIYAKQIQDHELPNDPLAYLSLVEMAQEARVKCLVLFGYEGFADDRLIEEVTDGAIRYAAIPTNQYEVEVIAAYDGLKIEI